MYISQIAPGAQSRETSAPTKTSGMQEGKSMAQAMAEALAATEEPRAASEMTLEEYAAYIRDAISALPMSPSRAQSSISVSISPEGLEAMRDDPEYEKWVLDGLAADFAAVDPWAAICGGHYTVHKIGATKEEYVGQSWFPEYMGGKGTAMYQEKSSGSLWKKSGALSKSDAEWYDKMRARLRLDRYLKKVALQRADLQSEMLEQASRNRQMVEAMNRSGEKPVSLHTPVELHGVPAAELLAILGNGL